MDHAVQSPLEAMMGHPTFQPQQGSTEMMMMMASSSSSSHAEEEDFDLEPTPLAPEIHAAHQQTATLSTEEQKNQARQMVHDATKSIPFPDKEAYLEAVEKCPELVRTESDPLQFLRYCEHDLWAAAIRLCCYWRYRVRICGRVRAFLPLDLTGNGAVDPEAIENFERGYYYPLPPLANGQDASYVDRRQANFNQSPESLLQPILYIVKEHCKKEENQTKGIKVFMMLVMPNMNGIYTKAQKLAWPMVADAIPLKVHIHFIVYSPKAVGISYYSQQLIASYIQNMLSVGIDSSKFEVHIASTKEDMLKELVDVGARKESLPESLGGTWKVSGLVDWCNELFGNKVENDQPKIKDDKDGTISDEEKEKARKSVHEAIKDIPENDKNAYKEATRKCPMLVETESDPFLYWEFCKSDIWAAGQKLCKYWQFRRDVFGPEKAFLPLDLTGHGAMDRDDIKLLQSGWISLLPPWKNKSQPVVFADRRKLLPTCTLEQKLRVVLYLTKECCVNYPSVPSEGVHYLFLLAMPKMNKVQFDQELTRVLSIFAYEALPLKLNVKVILDLPKRLSKEDDNFSLQNIFSKYLKSALDAGGEMCDFDLLYEHKKGDILNKLIGHGALKAGLPESVGGTWKYSQMIDWCTEKMKADRQKGSNKRLPSMSLEERKAARRASNAIHSRRKREKRKAEVQRLQAEEKRLRLENSGLKVEGNRLQCLLQEAIFFINRPGLHNGTATGLVPCQSAGDRTPFSRQQTTVGPPATVDPPTTLSNHHSHDIVMLNNPMAAGARYDETPSSMLLDMHPSVLNPLQEALLSASHTSVNRGGGHVRPSGNISPIPFAFEQHNHNDQANSLSALWS